MIQPRNKTSWTSNIGDYMFLPTSNMADRVLSPYPLLRRVVACIDATCACVRAWWLKVARGANSILHCSIGASHLYRRDHRSRMTSRPLNALRRSTVLNLVSIAIMLALCKANNPAIDLAQIIIICPTFNFCGGKKKISIPNVFHFHQSFKQPQQSCCMHISGPRLAP
jgi:hypothetical protein